MLESNMLKNMAMYLILFFGILITAPLTNQPVPVYAHVYKPVDMKQLACLAVNIFYEANGESVTGQAAVARVVLNRVSHGFARTPCDVVYQTIRVVKTDEDSGEDISVKICQFSWVCDGKEAPSKQNTRYKQAEKIALAVMTEDAFSDVVPKNALFFHNALVKPNWPYRQVAMIGNHVFYSKEKRAS